MRKVLYIVMLIMLINIVIGVNEVNKVKEVEKVKYVEYLNQPKMTFGGTDYFSYEPSQLLFIQLINGNGQGEPIDNALCFAEVYGSDATTHLIVDAPLIHTEHGLYHLTTNLVEPGVHIVAVECYYQYNQTIENVLLTNTSFGNYIRLPPIQEINVFSSINGGSSFTNETSLTNILDGFIASIRFDWTNKLGKINSSTPITNSSILSIWGRNIAQLGKTFYITDITGSITYGSYIIDNTATYEWNNITLTNLSSGVTEIYLSDLGQAGPMDIDIDYISLNLVGGGVWNGNPDTNNTLSNIYLEDNLYWKAVESSSDKLDIIFTLGNITGIYNETASLNFDGKWSEPTENLKISIYNYNTSTWNYLPNQIVYSTIDTDFNNQINNISNYINNLQVKIRINDTSTNTNYGILNIDKLRLLTYSSSGEYVADVKGGGEIHIINSTPLTNNVWNAPNRQLTALNFDTTNEDEVWNYNETINPNLLTQIGTKIWNFIGRYTHGVII